MSLNLNLDLIPCEGYHDPQCVIPNNPEHWPIIGRLVTELTDLVGHFIPERGCQNGYYGLALLIGIIVAVFLLAKHFAKRQMLAVWHKISGRRTRRRRR